MHSSQVVEKFINMKRILAGFLAIMAIVGCNGKVSPEVIDKLRTVMKGTLL